MNVSAGHNTISVGFDGDDFVTTLKKVVRDGAFGTDTLNDTNPFAFDPILVSIV